MPIYLNCKDICSLLQTLSGRLFTYDFLKYKRNKALVACNWDIKDCRNYNKYNVSF